MYNKDASGKFCVYLFIMAYPKNCFIYNLDVYQGNNKENVDTQTRTRGLTKTPKAVSNSILKTKILNNLNGCIYMLLENRY